MRLSIVALKVRKLSYSQLADLADSVFAGLTAAVGVYSTPFPALTVLSAANSAFRLAITAWGDVGHRGSHTDLENLHSARDTVRQVLFQLAVYAEGQTPGDRVNLASCGWSLRAIPRRSVGTLQAVHNLHQFFSRRIIFGTLRLDWDKPLDAVDIKPTGYKVYRSSTSDFSAATEVTFTTKTSFTDTNPGTDFQYYWVIPYTASGPGVISDVVKAIATPMP